MPNETTNKQLRSFGFTVGGIFALIGFWPLVIRAENLRWWALVVAGCLLVPAIVFPKSLALGSQRMDGDWPRPGLDQYENHSRCSLLCYRDSHWNVQTMAGKRSDGPAVETRPRQLPRCPQAPAGVASNEAVLVSEQLAVSGKQ